MPHVSCDDRARPAPSLIGKVAWQIADLRFQFSVALRLNECANPVCPQVGLALSGRLDSQQAAVGSSATIVAISYYVAPLTTLAQVLRTKCAFCTCPTFHYAFDCAFD